MMTNLEFTEEMRSILAKMKGEVFENYECIREKPMWVQTTLRINLESFSIDLFNEYEGLPGFFEDESIIEEAGKFWCTEPSKDKPFEPGLLNIEAHLYEVNEKIKSIKIVNDYVQDMDRDYNVKVDQAILIETENSKISFYKEGEFDEFITINIDKDEFKMISEEEVRDAWSLHGNKIEVTRTIIEL